MFCITNASPKIYRRTDKKGSNLINDQLGIEILGSKNQLQDDFKVLKTILNSAKKIKSKKFKNLNSKNPVDKDKKTINPYKNFIVLFLLFVL